MSTALHNFVCWKLELIKEPICALVTESFSSYRFKVVNTILKQYVFTFLKRSCSGSFTSMEEKLWNNISA